MSPFTSYLTVIALLLTFCTRDMTLSDRLSSLGGEYETTRLEVTMREISKRNTLNFLFLFHYKWSSELRKIWGKLWIVVFIAKSFRKASSCYLFIVKNFSKSFKLLRLYSKKIFPKLRIVIFYSGKMMFEKLRIVLSL